METVVLVLTDVQGSTRLWQDEPVAMDAAMARHHEIVHGAVAAHDGFRPVDQGEGDAVFAGFRSPTAAVAAVVQVQHELAAERWPTSVPLRVRIGVHVGEVTERGGNLFGDPVNRCARLRGLGSGGQTLLSAPVYELVRDKLPAGTAVVDLGEHRMKDLVRPEHVWQLNVEGLPAEFPPLASLDRVLHNLPVQRSPLIGRNDELASVLSALRTHRLVTLTGFGGMGKTRLALQAAAELADGDGDGVWFVDLAGTTDPADVPGLIGRATGLGGSNADEVLAALTGRRLLLVLDNLEQVMGCAPFIAQLLDRLDGVSMLVTSREPLRVRGEQELELAPLALPPDGPQDAESLTTYAAVQLFVDRAVAVKADFAVTNDNAPAVAALCQRLDGHPLAIELAAARVRMMTPQALLPRLDSALSVLTGGSRDMPGRHQTLRATIAWSYDLLHDHERALLDRMSVFVGAVAFEHVEAVCGEGLDVFDSLASLVDKSLVRRITDDEGEDRYGLLVSIRAFAGEQLAASGAAPAVQAAHRDHFAEEARFRPPYTNAELMAARDRTARNFVEMQAAWKTTLETGDAERIRTFPTGFFNESFSRSQDVSGLDAVIAVCSEPSLELFRALSWRANAYEETGHAVPGELYARLEEVAAALDRADVWVDTISARDHRHLSREERLTRVASIDAWLAQVPGDSPLGREWLVVLRDNCALILLAYVDMDEALDAARRNHATGVQDVLGLANVANLLNLRGEWQSVLDLTDDVVSRGVHRADLLYGTALVSVAARARVHLGRPQEALDLLAPWAEEVGRRGWRNSLEMISGVTAFTWSELGEPARGLALLDAFEPPWLEKWTGVLRLRLSRLAGRPGDAAEAHDLAQAAFKTRWSRLPVYLAALVEQATREPSVASRRELLQEIDSYDDRIVLTYGFQDDLDRLRADA